VASIDRLASSVLLAPLGAALGRKDPFPIPERPATREPGTRKTAGNGVLGIEAR
jgi:hypothetical protein